MIPGYMKELPAHYYEALITLRSGEALTCGGVPSPRVSGLVEIATAVTAFEIYTAWTRSEFDKSNSKIQLMPARGSKAQPLIGRTFLRKCRSSPICSRERLHQCSMTYQHAGSRPIEIKKERLYNFLSVR